MSYDVLETVRLTLVSDSAVHALVADRVYPEEVKLKESVSDGKFPHVTFSMLDNTDELCGKFEGIVSIDAIHQGNDKKTLWDIHKAIEAAAIPRLLLAQSVAANLKVRIAAFRLTSVDDGIFDEATQTYRLRSQWNVKYVRTV